MDFNLKAVGQSLAQLAIGGVMTIFIVSVVIASLLASNMVEDVTILALIAIITLIVTVVVIMQILSRM